MSFKTLTPEIRRLSGAKSIFHSIDNDECQEEDVCEGGICVNTVGSYFCTCTPPLVLDSSQRRCVTNTSQAIGKDCALIQQVFTDF